MTLAILIVLAVMAAVWWAHKVTPPGPPSGW